MAVSMKESLTGELRKLGVGAELLLEEFAEQKRLLAQGSRAPVVREKVDEFVAEDGNAAWLQADYGNSGLNLWFELVEDFQKEALGTVKHAEIVKRASAAEVRARDEYVEPRGLEDLDGSFGSRGEEVVVECVGPEEDLGSLRIRVRIPTSRNIGEPWGTPVQPTPV
jgi:hypothetical protein